MSSIHDSHSHSHSTSATGCSGHNCRTRRVEQKKIEKIENASIFITAALGALTIGAKILDSSGVSFKKPVDFENSNRSAEEVEKDINTILTKQECSNISEVRAKLETSRYTLNDAQEKQPNLAKAVEANEAALKNARERNAAIPNEISVLQNRIQELQSSLQADGQYTSAELDELETQIKILEEEQRENQAIIEKEEDFKDQKVKLDEINKIIAKYPQQIKELEQDIENLERLEKELKHAEGETTIKDLKNDETGDIAILLKKLNKANTNGNDRKAVKSDENLQKSLEDYYKSHKVNDNKTIDNLAKAVGFDVN